MGTTENPQAWSTTAADNDDADAGINWLEGQDPGTVNNSARGMMAALRKFMLDFGGGLASTAVGGTADAITLTTNQQLSAGHIANGLLLTFRAEADNTGAVTINVDTTGAKDLVRADGTALAAGDIKLGGLYVIAYSNATGDFHVLNLPAAYQPLDADLTAIAALAKTDGNFIVGNGTTWVAESGATVRTSIGLGTAATQNTGTSGATIPFNNGSNEFTGLNKFNRGTLTTQFVTSSGGLYEQFNNSADTAGIGSISNVSNNSVSFNTTSDGRRKPVEHRRPIKDAGAIIDALEPIYFRWDTGNEDFGFIAQEVWRVVPQAVTPGDDDPNKRPGSDGFKPWMMEKSGLVPFLVAELQALRRRVAKLEQR